MKQEEIRFGRYPHSPGYKARETSKAAAKGIASRAATLKLLCLSCFQAGKILSADEIADLLGESILAIRPRITELSRMGLIHDSGRRHLNASGKKAIAWVLTEKEAA